GITPGVINDAIETAVGGVNAGTVVNGRERYPIAIRYLQGFRGSVEQLQQLPIPVPIPTAAMRTIAASEAGSAMAPPAPVPNSSSAGMSMNSAPAAGELTSIGSP